MSDTWNEYAEGWDDNPAVKLYADQAFESLCAAIDLSRIGWSKKRVLDFGCGTGALAEKVAPHVAALIATDTSDRMISVLDNKRLANVTGLCCDILADDSQCKEVLQPGFDLIYASSVCGFLPDYKNAVLALSRYLKTGGHFIQWDWQAKEGDDFGLSENDIVTAFHAAKFGSVRVERAFSLETDDQTMPVLMGAAVA